MTKPTDGEQRFRVDLHVSDEGPVSGGPPGPPRPGATSRRPWPGVRAALASARRPDAPSSKARSGIARTERPLSATVAIHFQVALHP